MKWNHSSIACIAALALLGTATIAGAGPRDGRRGSGGFRGPPAFMAELYPPELVMRNQGELDLTEEQKSALMGVIREARDAIDPLQWQVLEQQGTLSGLLSADPIDEDAVLAQAEIMMDLEKRVKKRHLVLLVQIKNLLTPEQREIAQKLRRENMRRGISRGNRVPGGGLP